MFVTRGRGGRSMSRWSFLFAVLLVVVSACKPRTGAGADAGASVTAAVTPPKPVLPPEPPPPVADKAGEVPNLEAALAKDAAYQGVWTGPRADLNAFLSYVSELVAMGGAPVPLMNAVKAKKLQDAGTKLFMVFSRVGKFPDDFTKKLATHLDGAKSEPHVGTWSVFTKGGAYHDISALAAWSRPEDASYLREHIAAKATGAGPFPWSPWPGKGEAPRLWLLDEVAALDRLALLVKLTAEEDVRRASLRANAKKEAAAKAEMASAVTVSATDLFSAYQGNEVSADERFKGKKLLVSGTVSKVDKGPLGGLYVRLVTANPFIHIDASLEDSEKSKAGQLEKGDAVKLLCEGNGMVIGRVQLGDCTVR